MMELTKLLRLAVTAMLLSSAVTAMADDLSDEGYRDMVGIHSSVEYCGANGFIDPATTATGLLFVQQIYVIGKTIDRAKVDGLMQVWKNESFRPNQTQCNDLAVKINVKKQRDEQRAKQSAYQRREVDSLTNQLQNAVPKTTYCNKIGNQVMCNTY